MYPIEHLTVGERTNRGEYKYIHNGNVRISTAFEIKETAEIKLLIPRSLGATNVTLEIFDEYIRGVVCEIKGNWCDIEGSYDSYIFSIPTKRLGIGLYFFRPRVSALGRVLYGHRWANSIYYDGNDGTHNLMQLSICSFIYTEPTKLRGGIIYHIFVDRFNRGGKVTVPANARLIEGEWEVIPEYPEYPGAPLKNNTFYGGTLWGIIEKLDYIKSLGTTAIYLSPIFEAASNHKYDTGDYMKVDGIFGGERALRALIDACKEREIELILDGVFNHTGSDSTYFNREGRYRNLGAYQSTASPYYEWYDFQSFPDKYTSWWGIDILPRINPEKKSCSDYFVGNGGVIEKYTKMGIYGFRLDVADELSDDFISKIKEKQTDIIPDSILYGEVWEDASNKTSYGRRKHYYLGKELDGVMNYPIRAGIIDFLLGRGCLKIAYALTDVTENAPNHVLHNQMNLLGTHDTERILTILGNEDREGKTNSQLSTLRMDKERRQTAVQRLMTAYTLLATLPGIPTVFYGDEAGLEGYGDPFNRMPYPWGKEDERLIKHYRLLGKIRKDNSVYKKGDFKLLHLDDQLLVFKRCGVKHSYITVVNNSSKRLTLDFEEGATSLLSNKKAQAFRLSAYSAGVYKVKKNTSLELD